MVNLKQMLKEVITPALQLVDLYSHQAAELLLFTGLQESRYKFVRQLGPGPARSFWQVEPATMEDHYNNYLEYRGPLRSKIGSKLGDPTIDNLIWNMGFAVVMARLVYRRSPDPLPALGDGPGMAKIWKKVYNTSKGKGIEDDFIRNWKEHKDQI